MLYSRSFRFSISITIFDLKASRLLSHQNEKGLICRYMVNHDHAPKPGISQFPERTVQPFTSILLCTYPVIPSFVHVCIYFWFPLWLFLEQDSLLWNIFLEVSGPFYSLITRNYATDFNMNFLDVSLLL